MKIAIVGSRTYGDLAAVRAYMQTLPKDTIIVSGGALGVDGFAERVAVSLGLERRIFRPNYKAHGMRAPLVRNELIAEECDEMRAFWDGESHGTAHVIRSVMKLGKPAFVWAPDAIVTDGEGWAPAEQFRGLRR